MVSRKSKLEFLSRPLLTFAICLLIFAFLFVPYPSPVSAQAPQKQPESLLETADQVLEEMSRITGLPVKSPLEKRLVSHAQIKNCLAENLHAEFTREEIQIQEATLKAFGLVAREFDLGKFLITFYTEQAAGFYDPRRKTMFIADWVSEDVQKMVLAHELTHALQDQNFDLEKFLRAARADDDASNARQAVAEGHAMAAMTERLIEPQDLAALPSLEPLMAGLAHQQMEEFPVFSKAPYFFRSQALFPYSEGMAFMQRGLTQGGWKTLNSVFSRPPKTTKEIYEPELYFHPKASPELSLPRPAPLASARDLRFLAENTMGELGYCALLGQFFSEVEARAVGREWQADRYIVYEKVASHGYALVARTRWSTPEAASQFFRDYCTLLARKFPELAPDKDSIEDLFIGSAANGKVLLLRKGNECRWAEGVHPRQAKSMLGFLRSL